ncbi:MAG: aminomethyl-transferring glycine dehydrogenase subunit GcvPA [Gammaproteobacteria bacterium]|nr:aminomethyl-transferring glycine dehydrogenase subunit GcvPA [Gammaproteobacteria bacterium]
MAFIPHTETDVREMLRTIGVDSIDQLFDEIPSALRVDGLKGIPDALNEMGITRVMHRRSARDGEPLTFIGAGAYEHHIPAAVWEIATRGEFYSAYTPYQAEASQGTLQLIYEFQTMMASLTGLDVSNASMYDGASALGEATLMAVRANRKSRSARVLMPRTLHPLYRKVAKAVAGNQGLEFVEIDFDHANGTLNLAALEAAAQGDLTALVIPQPNFLGRFEDVDALTDWAHAREAQVIAVVNPISLALIKPPGEWGEKGADIACGEGQPLGIPLSSGGPYFGFMTCRQSWVRQMPGRIVGRTTDLDGRTGYVLTLQAREQHIRRSKATSNICTNQGLMVTGATIYMSLLGAEGLAGVATACMANTAHMVAVLGKVKGVELVFTGTQFHEAVIRLDCPVAPVLEHLAGEGIAGGYDLSMDYPELGNALVVCATETKSEEDIAMFGEAMGRAVAAVAGREALPVEKL